MARHEPDFRASSGAALRVDELLALLGNATAESSPDRQQAIACYLSASEGWTEAVQRLGGAFAAGTKVKGK